ncbi:hypothetical protein [Desulfurobacterium sp.]|uniref:hypothetical protein n=1 Tax=Desulfurobacterium sp. TaxID=2004706 RepID=UPI00262E48E7|nr:hypothetical protein [Desulfurobacterium sp.]
METANNKGKNIEALTSRIAYEIVSKGILNESEINKLLGVLTNNGVYAMWVYAQANFKNGKTNKKANKKFCEFLIKILRLDTFISKKLNVNDIHADDETKYAEILKLADEYFSKISENLPQLLLLKQLLEKTLTYARYHAKASGDKK